MYKDASISYALPPYSGSKFDAFEDHKPALGTDVDRAIDTFDDSFRIRSGNFAKSDLKRRSRCRYISFLRWDIFFSP